MIKDLNKNNVSIDLPKYSKEEIKELLDKYFVTHNPELKNKLIEANMRLVVFCANKTFPGIKKEDFDDLVSVGFEKLGSIIDRYNPSYGEFSTYAYDSLRGYMLNEFRYLRNYVSIGLNGIDDLNIINDIINREQEKGLNPSIEEISKITGFSIKKVNALLNYSRGSLNIEEFDLIEEDFSNDIVNNDYKDYILNFINNELPARERKVINLRFGLETGEMKSQEEIAKSMFVTRYRVRFIELKAINRIKEFLYNEGLYDNNTLLKNRKTSVYNTHSYASKKEKKEYYDSYKDYDGYTDEEIESKGLNYK